MSSVEIAWRDLRRLERWEVAKELTLPLPWLACSLAFAQHAWFPLAMAGSFWFFLAGLRLAHDAFHYNLSLPRWATESVITTMSILMLGSMHAVQFHHLRHHRFCLDADDLEGSSAQRSAWRAILGGPRFTWQLHAEAWRRAGPATRRWIALELLASTAIASCALLTPALRYHVMAMAAGHCFTAFFAVWTVHHDCADWKYKARTLRSWWKSALSHHMFYHVEHHLYPGVPTCRLPRLAKRLDQVRTDAAGRQVW